MVSGGLAPPAYQATIALRQDGMIGLEEVDPFGLSSLWEVAASGFALGAVTCFWCVVDNGHLLSWLLRSLDLDSD